MIRHARMRGHATLFLPGLDHASIAAQFVLDGILAKEGESRQSLGRERYLERMRRLLRLDDTHGDARPAAAGRRLGRLGPPALHDGRRFGAGGPRRIRAALPTTASPTAPRRSSTGARAAGRASSDLEVIADAETTGTLWSVRYHLIDEATGQPEPDATITRRHDPAGDDPGRHRGRRPSRGRALRRAGRAAASASRSWSATCRSSPTTSSTGRSGRARSRSRRRTTTTTTRLACATACPCRPSSPTTRPSPGPARAYDGLDRYEARRQIVAALDERGDLEASAPTRWSSGAASAATTSSNRASRPNGSSGPSRWRRRPWTRPAPGGSRILPERFEKTWEHWLDEHPRLERQPPAVVGPPHPGLVLPGRPRHGLVRSGGPGRMRRLRAGPPRTSSRTRTSSTPGSAPACGRSRPSAGRTRRPTSPASTRRRSWRPATTSSSSGSPG